MTNPVQDVDVRERVLRSLAENGHLHNLTIAWYNIFAFGDIFQDGISEDDLVALFVHLEGIRTIVKRVQQ